MYPGASFCRTIKLPATPPRPLQAVVAAAATTRFHCLRWVESLALAEACDGRFNALPSDIIGLISVQGCPVGDVGTGG